MSGPLVIIISGPPASGKTTLGLKISKEFNLPFINKDGIKERLYDTLGWSDREWSKKLGLASVKLLYYFFEAALRAGQPLVLESNFKPDIATGEFLALQQKYEFEPFQILCRAEGQVLLERYKARAEAGERHPGHVDRVALEDAHSVLLKGRLEPLDIGGKLLEVDTTDFGKLDYETIFEEIRCWR